MTLGRIIVDLLARTGSFDTDLNRSAKLAQRRAKEIDAAFRNAAKVIGTTLGIAATAAVTGLAVSVKSAIDNMDALRDSSIRLGIGVETLSAFSFAAQQTGTDIDALGNGFKILAKNMADALNPKSGKAQIFESLGIQVEDATGKLKSFEQIVPEIADKFKQLEDGTTKAALAQELFGKNGLALTEFLNQGGEGIKALTDRARELGIVIDQDAADAADKFKDSLAELKAAGQGLAIQVAEHLLPKLQQLVDWAVDWVSDGENAKRVADDIAEAFDVLTTAAGVVWKILQTVGATTRGVTSDMLGLGTAIAAVGKARTFQFDDARQLMADAQLHFQMGQEQSQRIKDIWSGVADESKKAASSFAGVTATVSGPGLGGKDIDRRALNSALGGVKAPKASAGRGGKSDTEKEADRLQQAYERQNATLKEQIALFGQDGDAAKLRYELEFGELAKLDSVKKAELLGRAESLDLMREEAKLLQERADADKREAEEKLRGIEATDAYLRDLQFEIELLGMTNKERERAIALRMADVNATDEQRAAIAALSDEYYEARKVADFWLEAQNGIAEALYDTVTGAESAMDAVKGFFDSLAKYILQSISEDWAEKIVDIFRGASGGGATTSFMNPISGATESSGGGNSGFWTSLIGMFFGARDWGGPVMDGGSYLVGERGPEMFIPRTAGTIVPARETQRAFRAPAGNSTTNIYVQGNATRETIKQIDRANGRRTRREMTRTS